MSFSGGSYDEVGRWLVNFSVSHAKRVHPRIEVHVASGDEREGFSYGVALVLVGRMSGTVELDYKDVAANRGSLAWCQALAERIKQVARAELLPSAPAGRR
jgi:hypothetical protein